MPGATQLLNFIPAAQKTYFIRPARHHVFGTDFEERDNMTDQEAIARFDKVWSEQLSGVILSGDVISHEDAMGLISEKSRTFCSSNQQHRRFRAAGTVFVAQVDTHASPWRNTQLWAVPAKNWDTRTLFVTFETQEERDRWQQLAIRRRKQPEELGLEVLLQFMDQQETT